MAVSSVYKLYNCLFRFLSPSFAKSEANLCVLAFHIYVNISEHWYYWLFSMCHLKQGLECHLELHYSSNCTVPEHYVQIVQWLSSCSNLCLNFSLPFWRFLRRISFRFKLLSFRSLYYLVYCFPYPSFVDLGPSWRLVVAFPLKCYKHEP